MSSGDSRSSAGRPARSAGSHRTPPRRPAGIARLATKVAAVAIGTTIGLAALASLGIGPFREPPAHLERAASANGTEVAPSPGTSASGARTAGPDSTASPSASASGSTPRNLPFGTRTRSTIADNTTQVVVVSGATPTSSAATVEFYERVAEDWIRVAAWQGHVGQRGWAANHVEGDLKTPVGTYALSDAGGRKADPGSHLPYHQSTDFEPPPKQPGFGDATVDAFDYVIAVDYNRIPGRSPLDPSRPLGAQRGGGIWLHVDHEGPTHGCVSIPAEGVRYLLLHLAPESHPVAVMGHAAQLQL